MSNGNAWMDRASHDEIPSGGGLCINGRYLAAEMTGVHRVAYQLVEQLGSHVEELTDLFGGTPELVAPRNARPGPGGRIAVASRSILVGQAWEQIELPARASGRLLLSLCNLAPISARGAVTMIHDAQAFITPESYSAAFGWFYRTVQPMIGHRSNRVLTVSDYSARMLVEHGVVSADRVRVIHNGVDHALQGERDHDIVARLGLTPGRYVLALSNTQAHKNIRVLLDAFVQPDLADITLVLFGAASPADFTAAGMPLPPHALCVGRVSDAELKGLIADSLCFAMPSTTEGFGLPPVEAMWQGVPAIVAPCGALPEVCGAAALYADAGKPEAWTGAIVALSQSAALRDRYGALGRRQAARWTWTRAGEELMTVLREVSAERRSPDAAIRR